MENGHISITLSVPDGNVLGISYDGFEPIDNVLEPRNKADDRGYPHRYVFNIFIFFNDKISS